MTDRHTSMAYRVSGFNRRRKWDLFLDRLAPRAEDRVLDVGFSDAEYSNNDNFIEKHYPHPGMLTALGIEEPVQFRTRYPNVTAVRYDGSAMPFPDKSFDLCWSNAVLEHVGSHANRVSAQVNFLSEIARVSRSAFVTTPNRWFPAETHTRTPFLHWLPKPMFDGYLKMRGQEWAAGDYMDLLSIKDLRSLLAAAGIAEYRIVRNRLMGFTLDFVVIFGERANGTRRS
jgi:hypothetical protein